MDALRSLVRTFCVACIAAGLVQMLLPPSGGRKVIKAVAGLYILLAVLHGAQNLPAAFADAVLQSAQSSASVPAQSGCSSQILRESERRLSETCRNTLLENGVDAQVSITLSQENGAVHISRILLTTSQTLSPEMRRKAADLLAAYGAEAIAFEEAN
jgi:hypothetical protein